MSKRILPVLALCLVAVTAAQAQSDGGGGRGGGGRGGRGGRSEGRSNSAPAPAVARSEAPTPMNKIEIVGVIRAIDTAANRITIACEPVEALNWPAGTLPFAVSKPAVLKDAYVGEKVRFRLDSQQISDLSPF